MSSSESQAASGGPWIAARSARSVDFDVIVIGAGHAGVEAAWAAARIGRRVAICTLSEATVAHMPCNPAVGGTAKGHLVREIDALGGLMGLAIDATGIQFKMLNKSRGPAVWSPRAQADKRRYGVWVRETLSAEPNITWLLRRAGGILSANGRVTGLAFEALGSSIPASASEKFSLVASAFASSSEACSDKV